MTVKKSFLIVFRIVFVLFSLEFLRDAFFKWDGFSYYMRFIDFLPDLSLAFILWTIITITCAFVLWLIILGLFKIIQKFKIAVRFEHIIAIVVLMMFLVFIKRYLLSFISLREIIGLNFFAFLITLIIGVIFMAVVSWYLRKHIDRFVNSIVYGVDSLIAPLVWLFVFLFVFAVPLSLYKSTPSEVAVVPQRSAHDAYEGKKHPNIILVTMDALTARNMQMNGYRRPTTPFISKWAKDAIVFNRVYASSNFTTSTVMSLMTGQRLWTHGIWYMANRHASRNYKFNFPRVLKDYGYDVYAYVQNRYAHPETLGITEAFSIKDNYHTFWLPSGWWFDTLAELFVTRNIVMEWIFENNTIAKLINSFSPAQDSTLVPSEIVYSYFLKYISQRQQESKPGDIHKPFFAWLHVYPPHDPYLPPKPYFGIFGDADRFNTDKEQINSGLLETYYKPEKQVQVDILKKRYDEFIIYTDKQFEMFISRLTDDIDLSNTIIILSADHGESFDHGYQGHSGRYLFEPLVHVPLVIKMPGKTKGKIIDMPIEQIDIAPTVLELAGIPVPEWMEGRSVLPLLVDVIRTPERSSLKPRPIFSMQFMENRALGHPITKGTIAIWSGDYKLIYYLVSKKSLLFNLRYDPGETQNIFHEKPEIAQRLKKLIDDNLSRVNARITQSQKNSH